MLESALPVGPTYQSSVHPEVIISILVETAYDGGTELLKYHI